MTKRQHNKKKRNMGPITTVEWLQKKTLEEFKINGSWNF